MFFTHFCYSNAIETNRLGGVRNKLGYCINDDVSIGIGV